MTDLGLDDLLFLCGICIALTLGLLWALERSPQRHDRIAPPQDGQTLDAHFLLRDDVIFDQDQRIATLPGGLRAEPANWQDLRAWLGDRFGPLPHTLAGVGEYGVTTLHALDRKDGAILRLSCHGDARRVVLHDPGPAQATLLHRERLVEQALRRKISILQHAPCAVAVISSTQAVEWCNPLFEAYSEEEAARMIAAIPTLPMSSRLTLPDHDGQTTRHVELSYLPMGAEGALYVMDVTEVAQAETIRREFIQTLTKTFANLTTGLAVFDRHRRLALFNPALLDLTGLPATFLSGQPPLTLFFDRLRDNKMLPEPRNYGTWRSQLDDMISSAADGHYLEDWHLVNGLTYRVTGRPHPDGAIAFLFEDISDEVAMTRQIRIQLDVRQAALDNMDKAIAVIGADRQILLCNRPCSDLLGIDPDATLADMTLAEFLSACQMRLPQERFWSEVERAVVERKPLTKDLSAPDGSRFRCTVIQIPGCKMKVSLCPVLSTLPELAIEAEQMA